MPSSKVGIFFNGDPNELRGPSKVYKNLVNGLSKLGIEYSLNQGEVFNGSLNNMDHHLPKNTVIGPNTVILPTDNPALYQKYKSFIVNSQWTYDKHSSTGLLHGKNLYIWAVGIDTDLFNDSNRNPDTDCFIYFKGREDGELEIVKQKLTSLNMTYRVITYGSYREEELIDATKKCKFCILLTGTESQGIGYMEILSANVPCYVLNMGAWRNSSYPRVYPASSVPYFDSNCGIIDDMNMGKFVEFLNSYDSFNPRQYIVENHTLAISAGKYYDILSHQ